MKHLILILCAMLWIGSTAQTVTPTTKNTVVTQDYEVSVVTPSHNTQIIVITDHTPSWQEQRPTIVVPNQNTPSWVDPPTNSVPVNNTPSWYNNTSLPNLE